jgi:dipeptidyl aminopeptidase/acylaminoacyl peptidase
VGVMAPNIRGSIGYGKAFQRLIYRDWGGGELQDIEAGAAYLRSLPWVDPTRLGICGTSFGGFVTLSAMTRQPRLWSVGVAVNAPSDLVTLVEGFPPSWRPLAADLIGDPDQDAEMLRARSPITHVERLRAPLLLIQSANDARVPQSQAARFVAAATGKGRTVDHLLIKEEGHITSRRARHDSSRQRMCEFLLRHLL